MKKFIYGIVLSVLIANVIKFGDQFNYIIMLISIIGIVSYSVLLIREELKDSKGE